MRKRLIDESNPESTSKPGIWLDLENLASVEVASENPDFPAESAFVAENGLGWRASGPGEQILRLVFDEPRPIHRIQLQFSETEHDRTQEFVLHWAPAGEDLREIVRQQWNFSPQGATTEVEDYQVDLTGVSVLQLTIKPDITHGRAVASLGHWCIA